MAKYKVLEPSFIGNRIVAAGEIVDVEFTDGGVAGPNLEAVDAPKKPTKKSAKAADAPAGDADADDLT
jgi:hypothetical protein